MAGKELDPRDTIEIGSDDSDGYSTSGSSWDSDTTSLASSIFNYVYENGRRYANENRGTNLMPNDETELERLDLMHHCYNLLFNGSLYKTKFPSNFFDQPRRVLDVGTGTGIWAVDFGDQHPTSTVIGIDVSPVQPSFVPPNVRFEIDDFESPTWTYSDDQKFDFIHIRTLIGSVKDWPTFLKRVHDNLAPGGYVEVVESDISGAFSSDGTFEKSILKELTDLLDTACKKVGARMDVAPELHKLLKQAGFNKLEETKMQIPLGTWPKDERYKKLGLVFAECAKTGAEAYNLAALTRILHWDGKRAKDFIAEAVRAIQDRKIHTVYPQVVILGQKD
ncbi:S-adenosyl-L-methionine-dependent methyltransferase [Ascobolus immersus RN42]|uniref:S-adenosyl-L-methionine-dependent methyltransferase n=1 Tax=Ascobolus immersus RN42 TaxID=1160509 RepID=A0A3N4HA95_ASCIM|nr:S-adenosyl-L-methionine-dependent methyltransferase [Ascobolus immersus RN42]